MGLHQSMEQHEAQITTTRKVLEVGKFALLVLMRSEFFNVADSKTYPELNFDKRTLNVDTTSDVDGTFALVTPAGNTIHGTYAPGPPIGDSTITATIPPEEPSKEAWEDFFENRFMRADADDGRPHADDDGILRGKPFSIDTKK